IDAAPAPEVRSDTAGRPLRGVRISIGDDPRPPTPPGAPGRIWLSAPEYMMGGYGFPPALEPLDTVAGWWGTPDIGALHPDGRLTVSGRLDDTFRTSAGHLVNGSSVAAALRGFPGIAEVAVVPIAAAMGPALGVLVESAASVYPTDLRAHLA